MIRLGCAAALAVATTVAPALAATPKKPAVGAQQHAAVGMFYVAPDAARNTDSGLGVAYGLAWPLGTRTLGEVRLFGAALETGVQGATDFYHYGVGADLIRHYGKTGAGHPFALVGVGAVANDVTPDADDGVSGYAALGVGWRSAPWKGWGLRHRLELRGVYDTFQSGQLDVLAGVTLEIGAERVRTVEVEKVVVREKIVEVVKEVPAPIPVDRDNDGVPDARDRCPDTVAGARVDADGCVREEQVVVLPNIEFEFARAVLTANGRGELDPVLRFLKDQPEIRLEVWGHTDDVGGDAYNLRLSQARAAAVAEFLTGGGVDAARLASAGFGETRPMADNQTEEGRARNRRVELHIRTAPRAERKPS
ncbi:MAG TPA: OmpA family protein [Verrucomicrobiae bacterium]|nr:OmpA family protein [Verrucomicrobiae bacterium]